MTEDEARELLLAKLLGKPVPDGIPGADMDPKQVVELTSGNTGTKVYGYNLSGDYQNSLPERHLTTPAIDCSDRSKVILSFYRWLGVEQPAYDHAYVRVSTDGVTWATVWENGAEITDASWQLVEHDLSTIADGQSTV
mgnify:CR=1 FL=1